MAAQTTDRKQAPEERLLDPGTIAKQLGWMTLDVFWLIKHGLLKDSKVVGQLPMIAVSDMNRLLAVTPIKERVM